MKVSDLPLVGPITNGEKDIYGSFSDLSGKKLLCVGFTEDEIDAYVAKYDPTSVTALTYWAGHKDAEVAKYPLVIGDITRRTEFADNSFDAVLTLSVLEHLGDLGAAFNEMARIVKPRGEMLHIFGPAWSCAYGHHTYHKPEDPLLNFSLWQMPAHMHLLCSRDEVLAYYAEQGYPETDALSVWHWFYETDNTNRVFYDDYMAIFTEDRFMLDRMEVMYNELPPEHLALLRHRYPGRRDFSTYGGKYKLIVRK
jgi:SAM-dependent methyltransferase